MDVRFGVVGTSWIASAFVAAAGTVPGVTVRAVASRSADSAAAFADQHDIPIRHVGLSAMGDDPDVDAVYIASPNSLHAEQAIAMLRAGKAVLVEKPLATTPDEAEAMIEAAQQAGRLLMEAYVAPFEPNVAAVRQALPALGPIRRVVLVKDQYSSKYDALKAGGLPNVFNPTLGGGSLLDLGIYPVALALHLFGAPASVLATGLVLESGVDGQGTVLLGYPGFEVACLHSKIVPCALASEIAGELGVLTMDDCSVPTELTLHHRLGEPGQHTEPAFHHSAGWAESITREQSTHHMRYEIEHFAELLRAGATESEVHPPSRSLATLRILDEARAQVLGRD